MRYMLSVGTAHDEPLRRGVAAEAEIIGVTVKTHNGPFGTVVVECDEDRFPDLQVIPGVTGVCADPDGCPYGQTDCESNSGGVCVCGLPGGREDDTQ